MTPQTPHGHLNPKSPRAKDFLEVFGTLENIPLKDWLPSFASLPGRDSALVYMLDLGALTTNQRHALVQNISKRFDISTDEVARGLAEHGCPILADDLSVPIPLRLLL